jgi:hypothetical protein
VELNRVREVKRFAVPQAQREGCLGSYKSFDSLFWELPCSCHPKQQILGSNQEEMMNRNWNFYGCTFQKDDLQGVRCTVHVAPTYLGYEKRFD